MKTQHKRTVLAVDDDEMNLMILVKSAENAGYAVRSFESGEMAWRHLANNPGDIDIALLDKMMPGLSGIDLLKRIKGDEIHRHIPVIIQTGDAGVTQMREGLENGAYYYLTKPFHPDILTSILNSAAGECTKREAMLEQIAAGHDRFIGLLRKAEFTIRTHDEARVLVASFSQEATNKEFAATGLMELLSNAIEHGNLAIGYHQKRKLLLAKAWTNELAARASNNEYSSRVVHVQVEKTLSGLHFVIRDEGGGFDWRHQNYDADPGSLTEPNGRGIPKAMIMLDEVCYTGNGNEVHCHIATAQASSSEKDMHPERVQRQNS